MRCRTAFGDRPHRAAAGRLWSGALCLAAALSLALPLGARADEDAAPKLRLIVVSGTATVRAAPDRAFVTLAVESRDKDPRVAQSQNAQTMSAVQNKLAAAGIAKDAVRTLAYQLDLESDWVNGKRVPRGYVARNSIEVRLDDLTRTGEIIDLATAAGANDVSGVRFDLKDRSALEREALRQAVADARARADAAAAGAGVTIDAVQRIEQQGGFVEPPRPVFMKEARMASAEAAPETPISAGEIEVHAQAQLSVTIR